MWYNSFGPMRYRIGDFSRMTRLSIKTLRFYHESGLLEPASIDRESGYRYYDEKSLERACVLAELKSLDFPLKEIKTILEECNDDAGLVGHAMKKSAEIRERIARYDAMRQRLDAFIERTGRVPAGRGQEGGVTAAGSDVFVETVPDTLVASIRFRGKYKETSTRFEQLFIHCGRCAAGPPMALYYDDEYRDDDADIETCLPVGRRVEVDGIACRLLDGGTFIATIHRGPYQELGRAYKRLVDHADRNGLSTGSPSREVYAKGPGMIFPGDPKKYVTEIWLPIRHPRRPVGGALRCS